MEIYTELTLSGVVAKLRELPEGAMIRGLASGWLHGDRGYYVRSSMDPGENLLEAAVLASVLEGQYGKSIPGWKGGDYYVNPDLPVSVAFEGDTGPYLAGFALEDPLRERPVYRLVGVEGY